MSKHFMTQRCLLVIVATFALNTLVLQSRSEENAEAYPRDVTLTTLANTEEFDRLHKKGNEFYHNGFDTTSALEDWYNLLRVGEGHTQIVLDDELARSGAGVLQLTTTDRQGASSKGGATYWFHPGYERVFLRRYIKFDKDYDQGNLNHVGGSLYAVAGEDKWAHKDKAGYRPVGDDRYGAGFEPWRDWHRNPPPGAMMLYTYWMDMKGGPPGECFGNLLHPSENQQFLVERDRWICLEHMIQANTIGTFDGEMAAWIDGKLYMHLKGFRWRTSPEVLVKRMNLGLYVHQSRKANRVWYDDVVLSTGYVGPDDATQK